MRIHGIGGFRPVGSPVSLARQHRFIYSNSKRIYDTEGIGEIVPFLFLIPFTIPIIGIIFYSILFVSFFIR